MFYLIPIPIIFLAAIVKLVSDRYKIKIFSTISKIVIIVCVIFFIYSYAAYNGFDIIKFIINFFKI